MWWLLYFLTQNLTSILLSSLGVLFAVSIFNSKKKYRLPPGPPNLPLVGSLPWLGMDPREPLKNMGKKYGEIVTVYLGPHPTVYLNTYEVIREAFANSGLDFAGRPTELFSFKDICKHRGIISSEGQLWKEQRRFTHTVLKDLGIGRVMLEPKIHEEIEYYLAELQSHRGEPMVPNFLTQKAVCNIIFSVINGRRSDYMDPDFLRYLSDLNFAFTKLKFSGLVMVFPFLRYLPGDPFYFKRILDDCKLNDEYYYEKLREHRETRDPENPRDFIDIYLNQMEQQEREGGTSTFSDEQLIQTIGDLFGAGTETTSNSIVWLWQYMLHYPDVMTRCQEEIDDVIGRHKAPSMKDMAKMPYCQAAVLEATRMIANVPFAVPHALPQDTTFKGYHIPKGTIVMSNIYAVHYDEKTWPEPYKFKPERHLTPEGKVHKKDQHIPFGLGRRVCIGESLAKVELFIFFTAVLQKFNIRLAEGDVLPSLVGDCGATHIPSNQRLIFSERN